MHDSIQSTLTNVLRGLVAIKLVAVKQDTITQLCRLSVYQSAVCESSLSRTPWCWFDIQCNDVRHAHAFLQLQCTRPAEVEAAVEAEAEVLLLMICTGPSMYAMHLQSC